MDFSKQLAQLQKSASRVASESNTASDNRQSHHQNSNRGRFNNYNRNGGRSGRGHHDDRQGGWKRKRDDYRNHNGRGLSNSNHRPARPEVPIDELKKRLELLDPSFSAQKDDASNPNAEPQDSIQEKPTTTSTETPIENECKAQKEHDYNQDEQPTVVLSQEQSPIAVINTSQDNQSLHTHHVTLLFLTIDELPHEHIWRAWIEGKVSLPQGVTGSTNKTLIISAICHAKYPDKVKSSWLRQRLLCWPGSRGRRRNAAKQWTSSDSVDTAMDRFQSFRPEWGSLEITRAMIELLDEGLSITNHPIPPSSSPNIDAPPNPFLANRTASENIPPADRFLFVSETCLPIVSLDEFERALYKATPNQSWLKAMNEPNNGYSRQLQWDQMSPAVPRHKIWKADQWIVLTRAHAQLIVDIPNKIGGEPLWKCFRQIKASDEMYFPTALALLGILKKCNTETVNCRVTYCDWSQGAKNPAVFKDISDLKRIMDIARDEGCLLARKFMVNRGARDNSSTGERISLQEWADVVKSRMNYEQKQQELAQK